MSLSLDAQNTLLMIVDVQERLAPAMDDALYGALLQNLDRFGAARQALGLDVLVTEQYPKGLGHTVDRVQAAFEGVGAHAKTDFSAVADQEIEKAVKATGRRSVVLSGMETHICVFQTARDLVQAGYDVHVLADAVASRTEQNYRVGLELMAKAGATVTSTETVLFDLLGRAGTDAFKLVSKLVR